MSLEEGLVFNVMACAYRHDVIDKFGAIMGEAIDGALASKGLKVGDLVNAMDEAQEATVLKMERLLSRSALLLKVAASDRLMAAVSWALDRRPVRRTALKVMTAHMAGMLPADGSAAATPEACEGGMR